jgi:hypothetical protein
LREGGREGKRKKAYMNLVSKEVWSFSKVAMNRLGLSKTSSYFARGGG